MHLLFDLDGTLTDPSTGIVSSIEFALQKMGAPEPQDSNLTRFIGPPLQDVFRELLQTEDTRAVGVAIDHFRGRFGTVGLFENTVYPGIPRALSELMETGYELRVTTSKPHVFADRIIDHFELREFFPKVYGSELSGERSDKGELIQHVLQAESIRGSDACMIGDRTFDIRGARSHGLFSIGVLWGFGDRAELVAAGPHKIIDEVEQLVPSVQELAT